ncbi:MAG: hypothetical protein LT070_13360 [Solirubrobacteraceae bacterium]|nr:hypothetical protein [Solirubrobacteraceae bacterium]
MEASTRRARRPEGSGWFTFAGVMLIISGVANLLWGIGALDKKEYLPENGLLFSNLTFWGWLSIIWAVVALIGAYLLLTRSPAGVVIGVSLATVSAVFWLFALPVLPIWALTIIAINVLIIHGLITHADIAEP